MKTIISLSLAALLLSGPLGHAQGKTYYRYINSKGVKVITDSIPSSHLGKGYEVINADGFVISVVDPEPSPEEKQRLNAAKAEQQRLDQWDKRLLQRYSHIDDINATKKRKLRNIDTEIFNLRLTIDNIAKEIQAYQAQAAGNERLGKEVDSSILEAISRLKQDRELAQEQAQRKELEKEKEAIAYDRDIERFKVIRPELTPKPPAEAKSADTTKQKTP